MAQEILRNGISIKKPRYYAITSETLDENSKSIIQNVFGKDNMFEVYGAVELGGVLAFQLKGEDGLYFYHNTNFLELENSGMIDEEMGNCIITDFYIKSFPLIRYRLGDWIEMDLGQNKFNQKIKKIRGREDDWVILPDGKKIPFHYFYEIMEKRIEVVQFRIIQTSIYEITVKIVLIDGIEKDDFKRRLKEELESQISRNITFEFEFVEQILPDPNGKLRMLISHL
jgi:phenylacetate-CoA ligase